MEANEIAPENYDDVLKEVKSISDRINGDMRAFTKDHDKVGLRRGEVRTTRIFIEYETNI